MVKKHNQKNLPIISSFDRVNTKKDKNAIGFAIFVNIACAYSMVYETP